MPSTEAEVPRDIRRPRAAAPEDTSSEDRVGRDLIEAAAEPSPKLTGAEAQSALDWLLSDDPVEDEAAVETLELNVGGPENPDGTPADPQRPPRWIQWSVTAVDESVIRKILNQAGGNRRQRRARGGGGDDGGNANLQIVVAGTVTPDLAAAAAAYNQAHPELANVNAAQIVLRRFKKKPGLIGQIADQVMELSGFDENDVRDAKEVRAAGN